MSTPKPRTAMYKVPVYEVRLVQARRPLMLAEPLLSDSRGSARVLHALIGLTDRARSRSAASSAFKPRRCRES